MQRIWALSQSVLKENLAWVQQHLEAFASIGNSTAFEHCVQLVLPKAARIRINEDECIPAQCMAKILNNFKSLEAVIGTYRPCRCRAQPVKLKIAGKVTMSCHKLFGVLPLYSDLASFNADSSLPSFS